MNRPLGAASALALLCALAAGPALAATIHATPANVWGQLHDAAQPGDTVQLDSGTYDLSMWAVVKAAPGITVTPAPGAQVVANVLAVDGSQNVTYKGITVQMLPTTQYGVQAVGAATRNVVFDGLTVQGASCTTLGGVGAWFRSLAPGSAVVLKNSKFSCLGSAIGAYSLDGLTLLGNDLQQIQTDGIIATGVTNLLVKGNTGGNFHTAGGGHPDFIQFADNSEQASAHVVIDGNRFERGAGDLVQGVFGEDGTDVQIVNNVLIGTMYNGIEAARTKTLLLDHNYQQALALPDDLGSWIGVRQEAADVTLTCNSASAFQIGVSGEAQPAITLNSGNVLNTRAAPGDYSQLLAFQAAPCLGSSGSTALPPPVPIVTTAPDALQPALDAANAQITTLTNKLATDDASLAAAQAQVTTLTAQVASLQSQLTSVKAQLSTLQASTTAAQVKSLQTQLATAQASLKAAQTKIANAQAALK